MALGDAYATLAQLKGRLGIGSSDTRDDDRMTAALLAASRGMDKETNRQFNDAGSASARVYYPDDWAYVTVDDFSTTAGLSVQTDEGADGLYGLTWTANDYQLEPLNGIVDGETGWPYSTVRAVQSRYFPFWPQGIVHRTSWRATVRVTARWGWATVPAPVTEATLIVAAEIFKLKDAPFGVAGFGEYGAVRVRQNPMACNMIMPYKRHVLLVG